MMKPRPGNVPMPPPPDKRNPLRPGPKVPMPPPPDKRNPLRPGPLVRPTNPGSPNIAPGTTGGASPIAPGRAGIAPPTTPPVGMKKGGSVKAKKSKSSSSSVKSKRIDGCAIRGKTRGRIV